MDLIYALLIMLGLRHNAPAPSYHTPVRTLPLIVQSPDTLTYTNWGPSWR